MRESIVDWRKIWKQLRIMLEIVGLETIQKKKGDNPEVKTKWKRPYTTPDEKNVNN